MKVEPEHRLSHVAAGLKPETVEKMKEREETYLNVMEQIRTSGESRKDRERRIENEKEKADEKRRRMQKANQLRGRIAYLRSKLMSNRLDRSAAGELSMAKTQLYWLMNPMNSEE